MKVLHLVVLVAIILITGCGGGSSSGSGTHDSNSSSTSNISSTAQSSSSTPNVSSAVQSSSTSSESSSFSNSLGQSSIGSEISIQNTMNAKVNYLKIENITLKEIGNSSDFYQLQANKLSENELVEVGSSDADLKNRANPIELENAKFYRVNTRFTTDGIFDNGLFFTISLVSTDKNYPFTKTLLQTNVSVKQEGEETFRGDVLIPSDIATAEYILVVKLADDSLDQVVSEAKKITETPQIGAIYTHIDAQAQDRNVAVLDVNTTRYMDTPYMSKNLLFKNDFLQRESGRGKFLFSNIASEDVKVLVSATLKIANGKNIDLGLLDPSSQSIKKEVSLTLPHYDITNTKLIFNNTFNLSQITLSGNTNLSIRKATDGSIGSTTPEASDELTESHVFMQQAFIPFAKNKSAIGEKRYRVTLSYYLPEEEYEEIIKVSPDLSLKVDNSALAGNIKWKFTFLDTQTTKSLVNAIEMTKLQDTTKDIDSIIKDIKFSIPYLDMLPKPVEAALDMDDATAYIFSGNEAVEVNPQTGEIVGEWRKTFDLFTGTTSLLGSNITAAFRINKNIYFFFSDHEKYLLYDLQDHEVVGVYDNEKFKLPSFLFSLGNVNSVGECMDRYLKTYKIDATFKDEADIYFIAGDNYMELEFAPQGTSQYMCRGGLISEKDEWKAVEDIQITAVLSDHKERSRLRFYLNGFNSKVVLNKPDIFLDRHNKFSAELGDSDITSIALRSNYGVQSRWVVPGVRGYANINLDLYLFEHPFSLFSSSAEAYGSVRKIHPFIEDESASAKCKYGTRFNLVALGYTFVDSDTIKEIAITAKLDTENFRSIKSRNVLVPEPDFKGGIASWDEEYEVFKETFPVGPILLSVAAGISGELKISSPIKLDDQWENLSESLSVKPSAVASVSGYMTGGVDYALVKAGVKGDVKLVEMGLDGELKATLAYIQSSINFNVGANIGGHVGLIQAGLSFFAGTKTHINWCSSWGVPYPCGLGWDIWDISIYDTPWLYNYTPTILDVKIIDKKIPLE